MDKMLNLSNLFADLTFSIQALFAAVLADRCVCVCVWRWCIAGKRLKGIVELLLFGANTC